jgi:hypothetical protein
MVDPIAFEQCLRGPARGLRSDVMLDAKAKDAALLRLREQLAERGIPTEGDALRAPSPSVEPLERLSHRPQRGRPQAREQCPALGVAALVLVERLGPDPQDDAEPHARDGGQVEVPAAKADATQK